MICGRSTLVILISSRSIKQEVGYYLHREGPNLGKHRVPCLLLSSALDAQFGTPYPRSAGFDTDTDLAAEVLNVLHEGVACELRAVVGDDSVWHTKMAD